MELARPCAERVKCLVRQKRPADAMGWGRAALAKGTGEKMDTNTLLIIILVVLVLGGGGFFFRRRV